MKKAFISSDPPVVQIDTSFEFDNAQYKVSAVVYLNPTTNKSEIASLSFISDESADNLRFVFTSFKKMTLHDPSVIIVDKDFNEIKLLKEIFPNAVILLCTFHVIKFLKVRIFQLCYKMILVMSH